MRSTRIAFFSLFALICSTATASSQDYVRHKLAQWGDPLTPPQTRTRCVSEASMTGIECRGFPPTCRPTRWSTCNGWATDNRTMQCEAFLRVPQVSTLPDHLKRAAADVAKTCLVFAVTTAGVTASMTAGAALAAVQPVFLGCVKSKGGAALGALSVSVDQSCGWSKWSND